MPVATKIWKRQGMIVPKSLQRDCGTANTLTESGQIDFILQGSRTVRKLNSLVLSHPFCGSLLCPLQETNTSSQVLLSLITIGFLDSITIDFLDSSHCLLLPELTLRHYKIIVFLSVQLDYTVCATVHTILLTHLQDVML